MSNSTAGYLTTFTPLADEHDGDTNTTSRSPYPQPIYWDLSKVLIMIVTMIVLLVGVVGNVTVLLAICIRRMLKSPLSYYMLNLAVVHTILSLVVCPMLTFQILRDTRYETGMCTAFFTLLHTLVLLLAFSIMIIGLDRVWREVWTWYYMTHVSCRLALVVLAVCWTAVVALVTSLEVNTTVRHPLRQQICATRHSVTAAARSADAHATTAADVVLEVSFLLSYIITLVCLVLMLGTQGNKNHKKADKNAQKTDEIVIDVPLKMSKASSQFPVASSKSLAGAFSKGSAGGLGGGGAGQPGDAGGGSDDHGDVQLRKLKRETFEDRHQRARSARVFVLLVALHTVCWLPFYMVQILHAHWFTDASLTLAEITHYLAFLSSALYPGIFYMFSVEFNSLIRQLLRTMCCQEPHLHSGSVLTLDLDELDEDDLPRNVQILPGGLGDISKKTESHPLKEGTSVIVGTLSPILSSTEMLVESVETLESSSPTDDRPGGESGKRDEQRRTSDIIELLRAPDADADQAEWQSRHGSAGSRVSRAGSARAGSAARGLSPMLAGLRAWGERARSAGGKPKAPETASSQSPGPHFLANVKALFRHGAASSDHSSGRQSVASGEAEESDSKPKRRHSETWKGRVAALLGRHRERSDSEQSLVHRLVRTGLPSGVRVSTRQQQRRGTGLTGVWRSSSGTLYRVDPGADDYDQLLQRMAEYEQGYETPTGKRIHHVCAKHHVHAQCHHHDWKQLLEDRQSPPHLSPSQETSINNWTSGEMDPYQAKPRPRADRATEEFGELLPMGVLPPRSTSARKNHSRRQSPDEDSEAVQQIHYM